MFQLINLTHSINCQSKNNHWRYNQLRLKKLRLNEAMGITKQL